MKFWSVIIVVIVIALAGLYFLASDTSNNGEQPTGNGTLTEPVNETDHIEGNLDAPVSVVMYEDFQCPACANLFPIINELKQDYSDEQVVFAYRHFPLRSIHNKAQITAQASEAAAEQGKFWQMHDLLYERQQQWASLSVGDAKELFADYAQELELDVEQFNTDIDRDDIKDKIDDHIASGLASSVGSTPSVFVNGTLLQLQTYDDIRTAIEAGLTPASDDTSSDEQ